MKRKEFLVSLEKLSDAELELKAGSVAEELMKLRFRRSSGQLNESHRLGFLRADLARVKTAQTMRRLATSSAGK